MSESGQSGDPAAGVEQIPPPSDLLSRVFSEQPFEAAPAAEHDPFGVLDDLMGTRDTDGSGDDQASTPSDPEIETSSDTQPDSEDSAGNEEAPEEGADEAGETDDGDDLAEQLKQLRRDYEQATRKITEQGQEIAAMKAGKPAGTANDDEGDEDDQAAEQEASQRRQAALTDLDGKFYQAMVDQDGKGFTERLLSLVDRRAEILIGKIIEQHVAPLRQAVEQTVGDQYLETQVTQAVQAVAAELEIDVSGYDPKVLAGELKTLQAKQGRPADAAMLYQAMLRVTQQQRGAAPATKPSASESDSARDASGRFAKPAPAAPAAPRQKQVSPPSVPTRRTPPAPNGSGGPSAGRGQTKAAPQLPFSGRVVNRPLQGLDDL